MIPLTFAMLIFVKPNRVVLINHNSFYIAKLIPFKDMTLLQHKGTCNDYIIALSLNKTEVIHIISNMKKPNDFSHILLVGAKTSLATPLKLNFILHTRSLNCFTAQQKNV